MVTQNHTLQDQYIELGGHRMESMKGRNTYRCVLPELDPSEATQIGMNPAETVTVDMAPCTVGYKCPVKSECPYYIHKKRVADSPESVHNYSYLLAENEFDGTFTGADLIVCDEGHLLEGVLRQAKSVEIQFANKAPLVPEEAQKAARKMLADVKAKIPTRRKFSAEGIRLRQQKEMLQDIIKMDPSNYIMRPGTQFGQVTLVPVDIPSVTDPFLRVGKNKKMVIMSATILDPHYYGKLMHLNSFDYLPVQSTFSPDRRPIIYRPIGSVSRDSLQSVLPKMAEEIGSIMNQYRGVNGVIHTVSYDMTDMLVEAIRRSNNADVLNSAIIHGRGASREGVIEEFRKSGADNPGAWLFSPSVTHGEDFPYNQVRVQVIPKMPYPYIGDPLVRAKMDRDPMWYSYTTMQTLWQMYGRACRADDDAGITFILDSNFQKELLKYPQFTPQYIREAIQ